MRQTEQHEITVRSTELARDKSTHTLSQHQQSWLSFLAADNTSTPHTGDNKITEQSLALVTNTVGLIHGDPHGA